MRAHGLTKSRNAGYNYATMTRQSFALVAGRALAAIMLISALALTFTVSDYYIFNRIGEYGVFAIAQWVKKAGLLLVPGALFFKNRRCADCAKYILPAAVIVAACTLGGFFDITKAADTAVQEIYNSINLFLPKWARMALFYTESACMLGACAAMFAIYGFKVQAKSVLYFAAAVIAATPLNIFENFFDIAAIPQNSFLRFKNFTLWHFLAIFALAGSTLGAYFFLRKKPKSEQYRWLCAAAGVLLLQYHSKDSMVMGDGYNVYNTVLACVPLFICNIGVYTASLAVFTKKRVLYAISFFIHAAGAISVFVYFGKDGMSNYGIFCSYSILYFCATHILLFMLCVLPTALGMYKFTISDCIIPLCYYFIVIVAASVASAAVTGYSQSLGLEGDGIILPNYAFTQINPLPFEVPPIFTVELWHYEINVLYVLGLYAVYTAIFFAFYGCYRLFLLARGKVLFAAERRAAAAAAIYYAEDGDIFAFTCDEDGNDIEESDEQPNGSPFEDGGGEKYN